MYGKTQLGHAKWSLIRGDMTRWSLIRGDMTRWSLIRGDMTRWSLIRGDMTRWSLIRGAWSLNTSFQHNDDHTTSHIVYLL